MSEALAILSACTVLFRRGLSEAVIFSDCKVLMSILSSDLEPPWDIAAVVAEIRFLVIGKDWEWIFIPRVFNRVAHWVAKSVARGFIPPNWVSSPPGN
ncbi:hypothetical protein LguiB_000908 [Lonicera macranthoides]